MVKLASAEMAEKKLATRAAFGATLAELAEEGVPVVAVDADLTGSTTTKKFAAAAPENADKLFNCGIAEQRFGTGGCKLNIAAAVLERIAQMPKFARLLFIFNLGVGN